MQQHRRNVVAAVIAAAGLAACTSTGAALVDPYRLRVEAGAAYAARPHGDYVATEDVNEGYLKGDRVGFQESMGLSGSGGLEAAIEARITDDDEARLAIRSFNAFEGESSFDEVRRFDGKTYLPGDEVDTRLKWATVSASYARRIAAFQCDGQPLTDVLARVGLERNQFHGALDENRFILATAPFVGLDTRTRLSEDTTLLVSGDLGAWNHNGQQIQMADIVVGLRQALGAGFDVTLSYQIAFRDARVRRSDLEVSEVRLLAHIVSLSVGLQF